MEIRNLTPQQAEELEITLREMQGPNPELWFKSFRQSSVDWTKAPVSLLGPPSDGMPEYDTPIPQLRELKEDIAALHRKLDLVFGGHVLMNGRFVPLSPEPKK